MQPVVRRRTEAGFTLLELLAALTVLAVLMALMFGGLRFGARVWESGDQALRGLAELQTAAGFIRRLISQALPVDAAAAAAGDEKAASAAAFRGTAEALRLVAPAPSQFLPGGLYEIVLGVEDGFAADGSRRLSVWWRPMERRRQAQAPAPGIDADPRTRQSVLIEGIAELRISYFGQGEDGDAPRWHDRWDAIGTPPALVSVRVGFPPGDRRFWPDLVVAPMASPGY
jgi:general secretion pathway protein J